jgi:uncharacterized membrane protein YhiD involved in acid resistance
LSAEKSFVDYVVNSNVEVSIPSFLINLVLAGMLSYLLSLIYSKFGNSLSNRQLFGRNFILITMTTVLVITIVKTSLALSLGLVGALSIVRFRAAIKEPEELSYIFIAIGLGLGFGANQGVITAFAFVALTAVAVVLNRSQIKQNSQNLLFNVSCLKEDGIELNKIIEILTAVCTKVELKRFDESEKEIQSSFITEIESFEDLETARSQIMELGESVKISYLDNRRVY